MGYNSGFMERRAFIKLSGIAVLASVGGAAGVFGSSEVARLTSGEQENSQFKRAIDSMKEHSNMGNFVQLDIKTSRNLRDISILNRDKESGRYLLNVSASEVRPHDMGLSPTTYFQSKRRTLSFDTFHEALDRGIAPIFREKATDGFSMNLFTIHRSADMLTGVSVEDVLSYAFPSEFVKVEETPYMEVEIPMGILFTNRGISQVELRSGIHLYNKDETGTVHLPTWEQINDMPDQYKNLPHWVSNLAYRIWEYREENLSGHVNQT